MSDFPTPPPDFPPSTLYAPAPWPNLKAQSLCLFTTTSASTTPIDAAWYAPLEANSPFADPAKSGKFLGGLAMVMLVRYEDTPVGPYDELLWVPGRFEVPREGRVDGGEGKEEKLRVTRIYVSTRESTVNGE
ncbi:hypothetical protein EX30DRAFT_371032 [Ascodesmis nigricans]|uniref:Uncharacterized protein n=1 Tax=Ascodesmis nigricans TaxID=341454 RepID=A0A4S2MYH9_9PEZI|nr:hypothetical protein EX30DRAFT_371032 [Ascodesmis nigricans]